MHIPCIRSLTDTQFSACFECPSRWTSLTRKELAGFPLLWKRQRPNETQTTVGGNRTRYADVTVQHRQYRTENTHHRANMGIRGEESITVLNKNNINHSPIMETFTVHYIIV